jgi:hypothetical protein
LTGITNDTFKAEVGGDSRAIIYRRFGESKESTNFFTKIYFFLGLKRPMFMFKFQKVVMGQMFISKAKNSGFKSLLNLIYYKQKTCWLQAILSKSLILWQIFIKATQAHLTFQKNIFLGNHFLMIDRKY